jgi:hypothetical protein
VGARRSFDPRARDAALLRLRRLTAATVAGATALAGVFAGLAASSLPGRKGGRVAQRPPISLRLPQAHRAVRLPRATTHVAASVTAATTPAPATPAPSSTAAPAPPPAAPAPTPAPPVVVSGGS